MNTYISTGGFKKQTACQAALYLYQLGFKNIELSGGLYDEQLEKNLSSLISLDCNISIHNYLPYSKNSYVLNLASFDENVSNQSIAHVKKSINICSRFEIPQYAVHAGFLFDPKPKELGRTIVGRQIQDRKRSLDEFKKQIILLSEYAEHQGVRLLIENNVLSLSNLHAFQKNPLLLSDPDEIEFFFTNIDAPVELLLDVAHFKVSSNALGFDLLSGLKQVKDKIGGLHLSDNNGNEDTNDPFDKNSWFVGHIETMPYTVIEVYSYKKNILKKLISICEDSL